MWNIYYFLARMIPNAFFCEQEHIYIRWISTFRFFSNIHTCAARTIILYIFRFFFLTPMNHFISRFYSYLHWNNTWMYILWCSLVNQQREWLNRDADEFFRWLNFDLIKMNNVYRLVHWSHVSFLVWTSWYQSFDLCY